MKPLPESNTFTDKKVIDLVIKLILILLLMAWCIGIILPFLEPVLWGIILAITLFPVFSKLTKMLKGRKMLASVIITAILLILIILPAILLVGTIVNEARLLAENFKQNPFIIPPPDASLADVPIIGKPLYGIWKSANENLADTVFSHKEALIQIAQKIFGGLMSFTSSIALLFVAIIIAGVLLATTQQTTESTKNIASRLLGEKGEEFSDVAIQTIRNVAKGILGVAFIQFVLFGIAFKLAGVPFAGLWAILAFVLAVVQLPTLIVVLPVVIYMFSSMEFLPAALWTIPIIIASLSDNILKPWLMGKGAPVPMLVIFVGAIGGFIFSGFIGLFTGAIVLSLGYKLAGLWLEDGHHDSNAEIQITE
jgi:predicted PurR-regulated permease PerM